MIIKKLFLCSLFYFFLFSLLILSSCSDGEESEIILIPGIGASGGSAVLHLSFNQDQEINVLSSETSSVSAFSQLDPFLSILPPVTMTPATYIIRGTGPSGSTFETETSQERIEIEGLTFGTWTVEVEALNDDTSPVSIGMGQTSIIIKSGTITECTIAVTPHDGYGIFELSLSWSEGISSPIVEGTISRYSGNPVTVDFTTDINSAVSVSQRSSGYYILSIRLYDSSSLQYIGGATEVVRIVQDQTTSGDILIVANSEYGSGSGGINIDPNLNDPIDIELSGQADIISAGGTFTVCASSPGELEPVEYTWHLNGEEKQTDTCYTIDDNLPNGSYRLDITAFNSSGSRGGSITWYFEVHDDCPAPPENPAATPASHDSINLSWQDSSDNESGFRIERSTDGTNFTEITTVPPGSEAYSDTGLSAETLYYYRISSFTGSCYSGAASASAATPSEVTGDDTAAHYTMNGSAEDSSTAANHGIIQGDPQWEIGPVDHAVILDGTDDYIVCTADPGLNSALQTISFWAQIPGDAQSSGYILSRGSYHTGGWMIQYTLDSLRIIYYNAVDGDDAILFRPVTTDTWHHFSIVIDTTSGTYGHIQIYVDGIHLHNFDHYMTVAMLLSDIHPLYIGAKSQYGGFWKGGIDDVRIYNRVLDQSEINSLYTLGNPNGPVIPAAPSGLQASAVSSSEVYLTWTDNSPNEEGFTVERHDGTSFITIVAVGPGTTSFTDSGLMPDTAYTYRVMAYNSAGYSDSSNQASVSTYASAGTQIIADHTVVSAYDNIPQYYIDEVKKMFINVPGESHSRGFGNGLELLAQSDSRFTAIFDDDGEPEAYRTDALRFSNTAYVLSSYITGYGEEDFWTHSGAIDRTRTHLAQAHSDGYAISAFGFSWCWDMTNGGLQGTADPSYGSRWAGQLYLDFGKTIAVEPWGIDPGDSTVNIQTYFAAIEEYITFAEDQGYDTAVFLTTGPVDGLTPNTGESGYQRWLKNEAIRTYARSNPDRILFDYADILCWNDAGQQNTVEWNGHTFPTIHDDHRDRASDDHIADTGAVRLGKAVWWMMARIAGWDGQ